MDIIGFFKKNNVDIIGFFKKNKIEVIIVLALFFLAFGIRMIPSDKFPNIYGFDSFYSAREGKTLIMKGYVWPTNDSVSDYPFNRKNIYPGDFGWVGLNALVYKVAAGFTGVSGFDYGLYGIISAWMVAIVGAMGIPAVYVFGRYAYSRWVGLASALLLAGSSGHLFYSIFGHAENDALGFTLFFLVLFSFVLTVKRRSWKFGLLTTVLLTWIAMVWQTYIVAAFLMAGTVFTYFVFYSLLNSFGYYKNSHEKDETRKWMVYSLLFGIPSMIRYDVLFGTGNILGYIPIGVFCFAGTALVVSLIEMYIKKIKPNKQTLRENAYVKAFAISSIVVIIGLIAFQGEIFTGPLGFIGINIGGAGPELPDYEARLLTTIAEQNPIEGTDFLERLSALSLRGFGNAIWFALLGVVLAFGKIFMMPFVRKDFIYEWDILALGFILFSMWTLTEKAITIFFLSGAIVFGAGYFLAHLMNIVKLCEKHLGKYKIPLYVGICSFILIFSFSYLSTASPIAESYGYDIPAEWFQTFDWLNTQAPANTVVTAWWDYGHWINYWVGGNESHPVYTNLDNIQDRADVIYTVASSFTHTTPCTQDQSSGEIICESGQEALELAEEESLSILKPLATTHILIDKEIILGKFNALMRIANVFHGYFQAFGCSEQSGGGNTTLVVCNLGQINHQGETKSVGFVFTKEQWNIFASTPWPGTVINIPIYILGTNIAVGQVNTRWFAKNEYFGGKLLYGSAIPHENGFFGGGANANAPIVFSFEHRIFFKDPSLKHIRPVYDNGWNVIYEVDFTGVPDGESFTDWTISRSVVCKGKFETVPGCGLNI